MNVIEMGEKIAKEMNDRINGKIISAVVYGTEIYKEPENAKDCNMIIVVDEVEREDLEAIESVVSEMVDHCSNTPLIVESSEIAGMEDSVPASFLDVLSSYQTVYGISIFKGLSTINHEHLRAQVEQRLRESLFSARRALVRAMGSDERLDMELNLIKNLVKRALRLYIILKKPWLVEETEKWDSFLEEFAPDNIWMKQNFDKDLKELGREDKLKLAFEVTEKGLKPLLKRVDEMGPE